MSASTDLTAVPVTSPPRGTTLVVDLDGTLTPTDTLFESLVRAIKAQPWVVLWLPIWLLSGRSGLKDRLAERSALTVAHLPFNEPLLAWLRQERDGGRRLVLATAANERIARAVQAHLQLFDDVLASNSARNLKGTAKLSAIRERYGDEFVYAGDSSADLPVWRAARAAVLVGVTARTAAVLGPSVPVEKRFDPPRASLRTWLKALRVHQWVKNVLLFVPALTAFSFDVAHLSPISLAFVAFSLVASATYVVNDLWDLDSDRAHPRKRGRPLASGVLSIPHAVVVSALAMVLGLLLAAGIAPGFLGMLVAYVFLTFSYSWSLKRYVLLDVLMLALLYTLRILAGAVAIDVKATPWLLAFSMFIFLSLALVKRCAELVTLGQSGRQTASGRDYRVSDLAVLWPFGVASALSAVVVFGLFVSTPETQARYGTPGLLWGVAVALVYWIGRLWIKTSRGEMHDDPVVYAFKDRGSCWTILAMLALTLAAQMIRTPAP